MEKELIKCDVCHEYEIGVFDECFGNICDMCSEALEEAGDDIEIIDNK